MIKAVKSTFYKKALSSKRSKEVWKTIHRILQPNPKPISANPDELNNHFNNVAEKLTKKSRGTTADIHQLILDLPATSDTALQLRLATFHEIKHAIQKIRNDCTGPDMIPINLLKPVQAFIVSPITHIINNFILE